MHKITALDLLHCFKKPFLKADFNLEALQFQGICIDSRKIKPNDLFVAISGAACDGNEFIRDAASKGAIGVLCSKPDEAVDIPQWVVPDVIDALAKLAREHRQKFSCPVIALTGSNGKTTVKEMIRAMLPKPALATQGNLNNHIGVPLSVLNLNAEHRAAVFELGANHVHEIAHTVAMTSPNVALINNIGPAHIGGFGSIEGVARAKGEIYQGLMPDGIAVVNEDDAFAQSWDAILAGKKVVRFSIEKPVDVYTQHLVLNTEGCAAFLMRTPMGEANITLQVPGRHNVSNALAAAASAMSIGVGLPEIAAALNQFGGVAGRMTYHVCKNNDLVVIDDTYNANLRSTLMALEVLARRDGRRIFVFGDMGELGEFANQHHHEIGLAARKHGIDVLMTCGELSQVTSSAFGANAKHYPTQEGLIKDLLAIVDEKSTTVLIKGSRKSAMERVVKELIEDSIQGAV